MEKDITPHIKIIILNWNKRELLKACLDSVIKIDYPNFSIVVIDNASNDGSLEMLRKKYPDVELFLLKYNYGYAGGYNKYFNSIDKKEGYFLILNNDTIVDNQILINFNLARKKYGNNNIYGAKIYFKRKPDVIWYAGGKVNLNYGIVSHIGIRKYDSIKYSRPGITDYVTGCCLFTSARVIDELKGFDEEFNMYSEDVDFCIRAKKSGFMCYYWPKSILWHYVSASMGGAYSLQKIVQKYRSLFKLYIKHK